MSTLNFLDWVANDTGIEVILRAPQPVDRLALAKHAWEAGRAIGREDGNLHQKSSKYFNLFCSFSAYCRSHPTQRFWQALCNWSGASSIRYQRAGQTQADSENTFYWDGRTGSYIGEDPVAVIPSNAYLETSGWVPRWVDQFRQWVWYDPTSRGSGYSMDVAWHIQAERDAKAKPSPRPTCATCPYWSSDKNGVAGWCCFNPPGNRSRSDRDSFCSHHPKMAQWIAEQEVE